MLSQQRFPQGSCYAMTGYQAVLLARRSGPGHVIRFANAMMCHIRDREGTISFIARNDRVTLRSQTSLFDYKAIYSTCRNRRSRRLRPRCVPQLEPSGDIVGASSHRYLPLSSSTFRGGHRARGRDQRVRGWCPVNAHKRLQRRRWRGWWWSRKKRRWGIEVRTGHLLILAR